MDGLVQDLRFACRSLRRQPGFALVAVVTLAVGFGVNVAMLSLARAVLRHPLPYAEPDRLIVLWRETEHLDRSSISFPTYFDWKERNRSFSHFALLHHDSRSLTGGGNPERLDSLLVSADLLTTLGLEPYLGRSFTAADDRRDATATAMVSYELWHRRFGGDPGLLGRSILLDGERYAVIGILPPGLSSETLGGTPLGDVWAPVGVFYDELPVDERAHRTGLVPIGRLAPGVDVDAARRDMARIARELAEEHPLVCRGNLARLAPVLEDLVGDLRPALLIFLATVGFVLLIACANLVSLLLTRFVARRRELAMRAALGASQARLVRHGLAEALVLAVAGAVAGVALAAAALRLLPVLMPGVPYAAAAAIGPSMLVATGVLCLAVTLLIGLVPALRTASPSWQELTGARAPRTLPVDQRLRQGLVAAELTLALVLLIGAGLAIASLRNLRQEDLGFEPRGMLTAYVSLPASPYGEVSAWTAFYDRALERLETLPGVESVAVTSYLPLGGGGGASRVLAGDRPVPPLTDMSVTAYQMVSPDYFRAMGIRLRAGRAFTPADDDRRGAARTVVISDSLARHFWPDRSAVGRRISFELDGTPQSFEPLWREVVGVVDDVRTSGLRTAPQHAVYVPYTERPLWDEGASPMMAVVLKTAVEPTLLTPAVRSELWEIDPDQPIHGVRTMAEIVSGHLEHPRTLSALLTSFAVLALGLALVGIYGVVSYATAARTREIGVRMALGARPDHVVGRLMARNFRLILVGIGAGIALASALTRLMESELYGVEALDPALFAAAASLLATSAFAATLVPAVRAVRIDPSRTLRAE